MGKKIQITIATVVAAFVAAAAPVVYVATVDAPISIEAGLEGGGGTGP